MTKKKRPPAFFFTEIRTRNILFFFFAWPYMFLDSSKLTKQTHLRHFSCIETFGCITNKLIVISLSPE